MSGSKLEKTTDNVEGEMRMRGRALLLLLNGGLIADSRPEVALLSFSLLDCQSQLKKQKHVGMRFGKFNGMQNAEW